MRNWIALLSLLVYSAALADSTRQEAVDAFYPTAGNTHGGLAINSTQNATSAMLDIVSTTKGFLPPRMTTTQKNAISSPATGLILFDTTLNLLQIYSGSAWVSAGGGGVLYAADTGAANAYAIAPTPAATAYTAGDMYSVKIANANTTASTLNVSSLGTKNILTPQLASLPANALIANMIAILVYDGTQFQLIAQQDPTRVSPLSTLGDVHTYSTLDTRHGVPGNYGRMIPDSGASDGWRNATYSQIQNGRPGKNYVQYADFENNATTGWTAMGCATLVNGLPTCVGSGAAALSSSNGGRAKGANTSSPAIDSTGAVSGAYALKLATTGAGTIGDGYVSSLLPIDPSDAAKVLSFKFSYKSASGSPVMAGTSSNTYAVAVYSPADNAFLGVTGAFCFVQSSGVGTCQGTYQTNSTTTSVQLFVYSPVAPVGASSLLLDDFYMGPQAMAFGPAITDWVSFTPTGSWSTNTTYTGFYRRHGDSIDLQYQLSLAGAPTSASLTVNLPSGVSIDTTKMTANQNHEFGTVRGSGAAHTFVGFAGFGSSTSIAARYILDGSTASIMQDASITQAAPYTFANADHIEIYALNVPITGWSSNTAMSSDTDTRVVSAKYVMGSGTVVATGASYPSSATVLNYNTLVWDTHNAVATGAGWTWTCPVTGYYQIRYSILWPTFAGATIWLGNALATVQLNNSDATNGPYQLATEDRFFNAGDTFQPRAMQNSGASKTLSAGTSTGAGVITIDRISGPAVVAASETVSARYTNTAGTTLTKSANNTIPFATKTYDSHGAWVTDTFTCPSVGKYSVNATVTIASGATWASGDLIEMDILKNGATYKGSNAVIFFGTFVGAFSASVADKVDCLAGDTIKINVFPSKASVGNVTLNTSAGFNSIAIAKVAN